MHYLLVPYSQESSTFPRCHSVFHIVCFFLPANNLVVWCFLLWNYMYFVFNTHMYMYNYSLYFPWFFSPLWEMAQEGIDIKTIQWSQHWATGPAPLPSPQLYVNPLTGISITAFLLCAVQFLLILPGHQTAFKLVAMWKRLNVVCGYLATVNKICTFYMWPHHYRVFVLCIFETNEKNCHVVLWNKIMSLSTIACVHSCIFLTNM